MSRTEYLIEKFTNSGSEDTIELQLDSGVWAKMTYNEDGEVIILEDKGFIFPPSQLSELETAQFLNVV